MSKATEWIMVRLPRDVHAALTEIAAAREAARQRCIMETGYADVEPLHAVVKYLVKMYQDRRRRRRQ